MKHCFTAFTLEILFGLYREVGSLVSQPVFYLLLSFSGQMAKRKSTGWLAGWLARLRGSFSIQVAAKTGSAVVCICMRNT